MIGVVPQARSVVESVCRRTAIMCCPDEANCHAEEPRRGRRRSGRTRGCRQVGKRWSVSYNPRSARPHWRPDVRTWLCCKPPRMAAQCGSIPDYLVQSWRLQKLEIGNVMRVTFRFYHRFWDTISAPGNENKTLSGMSLLLSDDD
jgi:hypothetical protein